MNGLLGAPEFADMQGHFDFAQLPNVDPFELVDPNLCLTGFSPRNFKNDALDFPWNFSTDPKNANECVERTPTFAEGAHTFAERASTCDEGVQALPGHSVAFAVPEPMKSEPKTVVDALSVTTDAEKAEDMFWTSCTEEQYPDELELPSSIPVEQHHFRSVSFPETQTVVSAKSSRALSTPALSSFSELSYQTTVEETHVGPLLTSRQSCDALMTMTSTGSDSAIGAVTAAAAVSFAGAMPPTGSASDVLRRSVSRGADGLFECGLCDMRFKQTGNRKKHIEEFHLRMKPYRCGVCSVAFSRKHARDTHFRAVHERLRPHRCSYCNKQYKNRSDLNKHIRTVEMRQRPFECETCGRSFGERGKLKRHMSVHRKPTEPSC